MTPKNTDTPVEPPVKGPERRPKWGVLIASGTLVLVCAFVLWLVWSAGSGPSAEDPITETYGPWQFEWQPPFWQTAYRRNDQDYTIKFRYLPGEVDNITVQGGDVRLTAPYYLSFDPDMSNASKTQVALSFTDSSAKLKGLYGETPIGACTTNETDPACENVPVVTCDSNVSAIVFTETQTPSVTLDGTCIHVRGSGADIYRAENLMWYRLLGIVR